MTHAVDGLGVRRHMRGLKKSPEDARDLVLSGGTGLAASLPPTYLARRAELPPVFDQGELGSCTANMGCLVLAHAAQALRQTSAAVELSRLDLYAETRVAEGERLADDSGCSIRGTFSTMRKAGVCREDLWPYVVARFDEDPPAEADSDAARNKVDQYVRASGLHAIQAAIARGHVLGFGLEVPEQMMSPEVAQSGVVAYEPGQRLVGGHALVCWGWETDEAGVLWLWCRNSWGQGWGDEGNFRLDHRFLQPPPYGELLATDFFYCKAAHVEVLP